MADESVERIEKAAEGAGEQEVKTGPSDRELPMEDFDSLSVPQATARLDSLSSGELERVKSYELEHKNRKTLIAELDKRLAVEVQQQTPIEEPDKRPAAEEQEKTPIEEPDKKPAAEAQQEGVMDESWFSAYRNWILAAVGAVVLFWLIF